MTLRAMLHSLHDANVLHRDVRSWNIMTHADGKLTIIDFDRASLQGMASEFDAENDRLERLIAGQYVDQEPVIGKEAMSENIMNLVLDNKHPT